MTGDVEQLADWRPPVCRRLLSVMRHIDGGLLDNGLRQLSIYTGNPTDLMSVGYLAFLCKTFKGIFP
jgi:hypothetical protein